MIIWGVIVIIFGIYLTYSSSRGIRNSKKNDEELYSGDIQNKAAGVGFVGLGIMLILLKLNII